MLDTLRAALRLIGVPINGDGLEQAELLEGFGRIDKPGFFELDTGGGIVLNFFPQRQSEPVIK